MKTIAYILCAVAVLAVANCLCSCAALEDAPITIGIEGQHGTYSYSSKGGLVIQAKVNPDK